MLFLFFYLWFFCLNSGCRGKGLAFISCLQGGEYVSYCLFLELKFRVVGAMLLGLKVDVCFSNFAEKTFCSCFRFSFFVSLVSYSLFKISVDPLGRGEMHKVSHKVFFL